mmetsp:Transcript_7819/g.25784  ORF Transcript_7819/g.25784 Transcript_7819/m.25784 type:complete len:203 (+) Transcript_7819:379-987(+)
MRGGVPDGPPAAPRRAGSRLGGLQAARRPHLGRRRRASGRLQPGVAVPLRARAAVDVAAGRLGAALRPPAGRRRLLHRARLAQAQPARADRLCGRGGLGLCRAHPPPSHPGGGRRPLVGGDGARRDPVARGARAARRDLPLRASEYGLRPWLPRHPSRRDGGPHAPAARRARAAVRHPPRAAARHGQRGGGGGRGHGGGAAP